MSAVGTLMVTAAASLGAIAAVRALRKRLAARQAVSRDTGGEPVIDLEPDRESGVWRIPEAPNGGRG